MIFMGTLFFQAFPQPSEEVLIPCGLGLKTTSKGEDIF